MTEIIRHSSFMLVLTTILASVLAATSPCSRPYIVQQGDTCDSIALAQNILTFTFVSPDKYSKKCEEPFATNTTLCLPKPCEVYLVKEKETCLEIIRDARVFMNEVMLRSYNLPRIPSMCDRLEYLHGTYICISPPGGHQIRAGASPPAAPPQGIPVHFLPYKDLGPCVQSYQVKPSETCADISRKLNITVDALYSMNTDLANSNCTSLTAGEMICRVARAKPPPTPVKEKAKLDQEMGTPPVRSFGSPTIGMETATPMFYTSGPNRGKKICSAWVEHQRDDCDKTWF